MANATVSNLGQVNAGGSTTALFRKNLLSEVMASFYNKNIMFRDRHVIRTIADGKSAAFPFTGTTTAAYYTPGTEIVGTQINHNEMVISIDSQLVASAFIAEIDDLQNHYDARKPYVEALGQALALTGDKQVLQVGVLAARASAVISGGNGGTALTNASYGTVATVLAGGLFSAAQKFDEKNVPTDERFAVFKPAQYYLLAQELDLINKDWGGAGAYSDGTVVRIAGIEILKSNNLPTTDLSGASSTGQNNTYNANFSTTVGLVMHPQAVGTVKLQDLKLAMDWDPRRLGTLLTARYAMGHNILRPECAVELKTS